MASNLFRPSPPAEQCPSAKALHSFLDSFELHSTCDGHGDGHSLSTAVIPVKLLHSSLVILSYLFKPSHDAFRFLDLFWGNLLPTDICQ